jgi:hypothetical protein
MKYAKMLGLLAIAAAALMAFAASASADTVTSNTGATPIIEATSEGATSLDGTVEVTCQHSYVKGTVTTHGAGKSVGGHISTLTFTQCGDDHVTVKQAGSLTAHAVAPTGNATLTSTGAEVTIEADTIFGNVHCVYTTNNTHIGTLTAGANPTMHIDSAQIPRTGGSFLCGSSGEWTGAYNVLHPKDIQVHDN